MRTKLFLFTSFLLIATESFAQSFTLPLWSGEIPNNRKINEVEVRDSSDAIRISNVQIPAITVYLPTKNIRDRASCSYMPRGWICKVSLR